MVMIDERSYPCSIGVEHRRVREEMVDGKPLYLGRAWWKPYRIEHSSLWNDSNALVFEISPLNWQATGMRCDRQTMSRQEGR